MNANEITIDKAAEKRAKNAAKARERRAAAKAAKLAEAEAGDVAATSSDWQEVTIDGLGSIKVDASLSPEDAEQAARDALRKLETAKTTVAAAKADEKAITEKPVKPVKLKGDPQATVFYRLSRTAMEALEGKPGAQFRKDEAAIWKILKASKRITGGQSWAFTGHLRPEAATTLAATLRSIAGTGGFAKPGSLLTNADKLESNHYVTKAAEKR
jgi:hypothetical protein